MKYQVVYDSRTGNTQKLAEHIFNCLEGEERDIKTASEFDGTEEADLYFIGFCTHRSSCSMDIADVLGMLEGKKIALFGTCGMGNIQEYYKKIRKNVDVWMPEEYEDRGFFMCQGRIPGRMNDAGLSHPDAEDLKQLEIFIRNAISM